MAAKETIYVITYQQADGTVHHRRERGSYNMDMARRVIVRSGGKIVSIQRTKE